MGREWVLPNCIDGMTPVVTYIVRIMIILLTLEQESYHQYNSMHTSEFTVCVPCLVPPLSFFG